MPAEPDAAAWSRRSARLGSLRDPESGNAAPLVIDDREHGFGANQERAVLARELDERRASLGDVEFGDDLANGELHREVISIRETYDCHGLPRVPGRGSPGRSRTSTG